VKRLIFSVFLAFLMSSTADAASKACMRDTADNQAKVEEYVINVMKDKRNMYARPTFYEGHCGNGAALKECKAIIEKTIKMTEAGLIDKIEMPRFKFDGSE